ncbi:MAG: cupin domain-containing protein [Thermoleophilia bacterium]
MSAEDQIKALPSVQIDNDRVRVTQWSFAPGAHTGRHVHEFAYVVVPLTDGTLELTTRDGRSTGELRAGGSYYRPAGVEHDVANAGPGGVVFVEIEMKAHPRA